ncbi:hypothetical protein C8J27_105274 [Rhodobacter aestuarii]|uniref:Competence protein CoiA nuclease-like domain-containing protein n=2 Tax=Rhodobacter aestuarii TaxID=453582 RepID=A0A1N7LCP7_9RHOB|nr:hypothetical protein C8J27_105274 [Rhodobacter aestuarii]SIS71540.1 hypothetical protein SAMN05421580_1042 [Rhodobacter aestuarii]
MPRSQWPAIPKTSIKGLRFFAHYPGYTGVKPKPESYAHTRLKIDILKAARTLGFDSQIEAAGRSPDGAEWIADVLVTLPTGQKTAFEVQLSSQHLADFRLRTERYRHSSVACCWVVSEHPVASRLAKALAYDNMDWYKKHGELLSESEELMVLGLLLEDKASYPAQPLLRLGYTQEARKLTIQEAVEGVLRGRPRWEQAQWKWY